MSGLKFVLLSCTGLILAAWSVMSALADDAPPPPPPKEAGADWDKGPAPGSEPGGAGPRRSERPHQGPHHPEGDGRPDDGRLDNGGPPRGHRQPPGPPPLFPQRGHEDFLSLKTTDPELFKAVQEDRDLERQTRDQADQFRRAGKDEQAKIKEKLAEIVNKHFEVRQQLRALEVKRLEQQLKQLRDKIDQREKDRKEIVAKRISELTEADEEEHF